MSDWRRSDPGSWQSASQQHQGRTQTLPPSAHSLGHDRGRFESGEGEPLGPFESWEDTRTSHTSARRDSARRDWKQDSQSSAHHESAQHHSEQQDAGDAWPRRDSNAWERILSALPWIIVILASVLSRACGER